MSRSGLWNNFCVRNETNSQRDGKSVKNASRLPGAKKRPKKTEHGSDGGLMR
jgi:hypothetical protein